MIDQGLRVIGWRSRSTTASRLGAVAPVPFVGLAVILVALIIFTPVLLATGPTPLAVQAELYVYRVVGSPTTEFEVHGFDAAVPYHWINVSLGTGFLWKGGCPSIKLNWTTTSETNSVGSNVVADANPVVVNVTAIYDHTGGRTVYAGELAFYIAGFNSSGESIDYAPCSWTPGLGPASSWTVSLGMLALSLVDYGSGGPP